MTAPVATDHANSFQAVAMRVGKLDATGAAVKAIGSVWTTSKFISVGFTPTYAAGADLNQMGADGTVCAEFKAPDMLRYVALTIAVCDPEPSLRQLLSGGSLLTPPPGSGAVTGYAAPQQGTIPNPNGTSLEVWSRAILNGKPAGTNPYWMWVFPYVQVWPTGDTVLENGMPAMQFTGYGYGNPQWSSVDTAWPFSADRAYQYARTATVPTITNGFNSTAYTSGEPAQAFASEVPPAPQPDPERPKDGANRDEWEAYGIQRGASEDEVKAAPNKQALIDAYGG